VACPGHFGHVELAVPVYNPLVFMCAPAPPTLCALPSDTCWSLLPVLMLVEQLSCVLGCSHGVRIAHSLLKVDISVWRSELSRSRRGAAGGRRHTCVSASDMLA